MTRRISIKSEDGQSATEFALVLPLLATLLFAIIQFGIAFNNYLTLTDAVRTGARQAAVSRFLTSPSSAVDAKVRTAAQNLAGASDTSTLVVRVTAPDGTSTPTWAPGSDVMVRATYPYSIDVFGIPFKSGTLSSSTVERVE